MSLSRHPEVESAALPAAASRAEAEAGAPKALLVWLRRWWRRTPSRGAWLWLLSSPTSYLLAVAATATFFAKIYAAFTLKLSWAPALGWWATLVDFTILWCVAWLLSTVERRAKLLGLLTVPLAALVSAAALANATYLVVAGEQGSREALADLWERRSEALMIVGEELGESGFMVHLAVAAVVLTAFPVILRIWLSRRVRGGFRWDNSQARGRLSGNLALVAGLLALLLPAPSHFEANKLGRSALFAVLRPTGELSPGTFRGWSQKPAVSSAEIKAFARRKRPNVVVVVLESVRFDYTSLAGARARARTPNLAELAEFGWFAPRTRTVLPHTSKSLFSILCGRVPVMQRDLFELSADTPVQCLPRVLASAGYATKFFQSAKGGFEHRVRLVDKLGFREFASFEDIGGPRLGYLASEDRRLAKAVLSWMDEQDDETPTFAAVLTSSTHHPYRLSQRIRESAEQEGLPHDTPEERYARLIESSDAMLGDLVEGLRERDKLRDTVLVVLGDHGEGFGEHAVKQHDNNFYEEALRVPFVMAGPGIARGSRFDGNASLLDVVPTVLGALRVKSASDVLEGFDVRGAPPPADAPRLFGCFRPERCRGYVSQDVKVIREPATGERWFFNLAKDPEEREPQVIPRSDTKLTPMLDWVDEVIDARRVQDWDIRYESLNGFGPWSCPKGRAKCSYRRGRR